MRVSVLGRLSNYFCTKHIQDPTFQQHSDKILKTNLEFLPFFPYGSNSRLLKVDNVWDSFALSFCGSIIANIIADISKRVLDRRTVHL